MIKGEFHPILTEKTTQLAGDGWYTFRTAKRLGKKEAKSLIEKVFKVKVVSVRSVAGTKKTRKRGRFVGKTKEFKKILVRLKKGQKLSIFEIET